MKSIWIILSALLTTCAPARAETLAEYVAAKQAEGMTAAREIHASLFRNVSTGEWKRVKWAKPAAVYAVETNAVAKLSSFVKAVNPAETNALARVQGMETSEMVELADKRIKAEPNAGKAKLQGDLTKGAVELIALHLTLEKKGINFRDPDFGKPVYYADKWESEMLPSWWDANGTGDPPTVREIAEQMK